MGCGKNVRVRMEGDRISSLPDEIIHHILSFNDTKYAVQTSVLSSRWKLIWTTLPYLNFSTHQFRTLPKFYKFVNRVLSLRNDCTEVSSIDLYFGRPANPKFEQYVANYVVSHNVQKVNIGEWCYRGPKCMEHPQFPLCLFSSQSLKHLSIMTYTLRGFPLPQSPWDSPALTTIELSHIWFRPDSPEDALGLDLFSKCVNLTDLTLSSCSSTELKLMKILCPRLVRLTISNCYKLKYEILATNLSSFYYDGWDPLILPTGGLNSLEKVTLNSSDRTSIPNTEDIRRKAHEYVNMLHQLRNARFVTLYAPVIEFLSKVLDLLEHQPSPFCNLKCLSIVGFKMQRKRTKSALTCQVIKYLLNSSPTATVSMELPKEKLNDFLREFHKEEQNFPSKQEKIFPDILGKDGHGSCVGDGPAPAKSMVLGNTSTTETFAAVGADFEAKMESHTMSMEVEFSRHLDAQKGALQVAFSRRLEAKEVEFSGRLDAQKEALEVEFSRRLDAQKETLEVEFSRRLEAKEVEFSRHLNEKMEAFERNLMQQLKASAGIVLQPL